MRLTSVALSLLLAFSSAAAQNDQTIFGSNIQSGGFGAPVFKLTSVDGHTGFMSGGRGGWIINHMFVLGGGGYGYTTSEAANTSLGRGQLSFGYGGLEIEYINSSSRLIHFTISTHFGGGAVSFAPDDDGASDDNPDDALFIFEPSAALEFNVTRWFRLDIGGSYRMVAGTDMAGLKTSDLAGPSLTLTLKFGKF